MKKRSVILIIAVMLLIAVIPVTLIACSDGGDNDNQFDYSKLYLTGAYVSTVNTTSGTVKIVLKLLPDNQYSMRFETINVSAGIQFVDEKGTYSYVPLDDKVFEESKAEVLIKFNASESVGYMANKPIYVKAGYITDNLLNEWEWICSVKEDNKPSMIYANSVTSVYHKMDYVPFTFRVEYIASEGGRIDGNTLQSISDGGDASEVTAVPDEGYVFKRWSDGVTTATRKDTNIKNDIAVTAEFECKYPKYTLSYAAGEGGKIVGETSQQVIQGDDASEVTAVPDEGYVFKRWSDGVTTATRKDTNIKNDIAVTAEFECKYPEYTLSYTAGEGGKIVGEASQQVIQGGDASEVTAVPDEGYVFKRWSDGVTTATRKDTNVQGDIEVSAEFDKVITYNKVTFDYGDGRDNATIEVAAGSSIKLELPTREGYTFKGWAKGYSWGSIVDAGAVFEVNENVTFYAKWELITYKITFDLNGGSLDKELTGFTINDLPLKLPVPQRDGYSFAGYTIKGSDKAITIIEKDAVNLHDFELVAAYDNIMDTFVCLYLDELQGYEMIGYTGAASHVEIPDMYNGKPIKSIGEKAFYGCNNLKSVTVPDSVTSIGNHAFENCSSLTSVTIGNGVTIIGERAFRGCSSLTSVTIGNGVTSIGSAAFWNCSGLTSINIPDSVTRIGDSAFGNCSSLTSINIPDSVTSIGSAAFEGCNNLQYNEYGNCLYLGSSGNEYYALIKPKYTFITDCNIADTAKVIADYAFCNCNGITKITIPDSVISMGNGAFAECSRLTSVTIGNGVASIGSYAFQYCSSLTSVTIGNGVASIGSYAFQYCSGLTSVTIGNSVTSISDYAFYGCSSLTSVTIGNGVTSIGQYAFSYCSSLDIVYFAGSNEEWSNISIAYNEDLFRARRYYYSETQPTTAGNFWHYDTDGKTPIIWDAV